MSNSVITIECSRPGEVYTMFESGTALDVHLAAPANGGGIGPCLCGFDRFGPDIGFSVGGGVTGPGYQHNPCMECLALVDGRSITGDARTVVLGGGGAAVKLFNRRPRPKSHASQLGDRVRANPGQWVEWPAELGNVYLNRKSFQRYEVDCADDGTVWIRSRTDA